MAYELCDKCKEPVPPSNNVANWDVVYLALKHHQNPEQALKELAENPLKRLFYASRHLYATEHCDGNPLKIAAIEKKTLGKEAYEFIQNMA